MSALLELELETPSFERVSADAGVVWLFRDERPLRGGAGLADWRLCGWLSHLLEGERIVGEAGECVLLPAGTRLRTPRLLALGLGTRAGLAAPGFRAAVEEALVRCLGLAAHRVVLDLPPVGPALDAEAAARALLEGARAALARGSRGLALRLHASPGRSSGLPAAVERASRGQAPAVLVVGPEPALSRGASASADAAPGRAGGGLAPRS